MSYAPGARSETTGPLPPSICFQPLYAPVLESYLSPHLNFVAKTADDVIARMRSIVPLDTERTVYPSELQSTFDNFIAAHTGSLAAERIVGELVRRFGTPASANAVHAPWRPQRGYSRYLLSKRGMIGAWREQSSPTISSAVFTSMAGCLASHRGSGLSPAAIVSFTSPSVSRAPSRTRHARRERGRRVGFGACWARCLKRPLRGTSSSSAGLHCQIWACGLGLSQLKILGSVTARCCCLMTPRCRRLRLASAFANAATVATSLSRPRAPIADVVPDSFRLFRDFLPPLRVQ